MRTIFPPFPMKTRAPDRPNFRPAGVQAALNRNHNLFGEAYFRTFPGYFRDIPFEFRAAPAEIRTAPVEFRAIAGCSGLIRSGPAYKYRGGGPAFAATRPEPDKHRLARTDSPYLLENDSGILHSALETPHLWTASLLTVALNCGGGTVSIKNFAPSGLENV